MRFFTTYPAYTVPNQCVIGYVPVQELQLIDLL